MMVERKEYVVIKGYGVKDSFFWVPSFFFSVVLTIISLILSLYCAPFFTKTLKEKEFSLKKDFSPSLIIPGSFFEIDKRLIYVHKQIAPLSFEGIILTDRGNPKQLETITGKKAWIIPEKKGISIIIHHGTHQIAPFQKKPPSLLTFKHYKVTLDYPQQLESRIPHPNEFSVKEIIEFMNTTGSQAEYGLSLLHARLLFPLIPLFYGTWVPFFILKQDISRKRNYAHLIWVLISSLSVLGLFIFSYKKTNPKIFNLIICGFCILPFVVWTVYGLWKFLLNRKNNV